MHHGQRSGEIFFLETGGKCTERTKIGGNSKFKNLWSMTKNKKRSSEIFADESQEIFREKVKLSKNFRKSENVCEIGGKSETGGKCIMVSEGDGRPCIRVEMWSNFATDNRFLHVDLQQIEAKLIFEPHYWF